jgi:hypothetical protein
VGPKRPGIGRVSRRSAAYGRQYPMDDGSGERIPSATIGCDGRCPADASKSPGHWESKNQRATGGTDRDSSQRPTGDQDRASKPRCCLRPVLRPDCGVRTSSP